MINNPTRRLSIDRSYWRQHSLINPYLGEGGSAGYSYSIRDAEQVPQQGSFRAQPAQAAGHRQVDGFKIDRL